MAGETNIGGIVGFLRLEAEQFHREIQQALLETDALNGKRVKVDVDTGPLDRVPTSSRNAAAGIDDATKSSRRLEDATNRVRLAELKLYEANDSGKASKIFAAQTELTRARRGEIDAVWGTYDANIGLSQAQDKVVESGDKAVETHKKSAKAAGENRAQVGALATAIIALAPAAVPLAAGAVGLGAAFAGMGAAGLAALVGIKQEMKAGTAVGETYKSTLSSAKADLEQLASTAARNVLGSFQTAVADLNAAMPALNAQIGDLSTITGRAGVAVASGVVTAFQVLNPLMLDASVYILDLTQRFQSAMSGSGMASFVDYVRSSFPQVVASLESVVAAVAHLVAALAPLGMGTLSTLKTFSDLISAIPTDTLAVIAQLAGSVFLGFRAWQALSAPINGLISMLGGLEAMSVRATAAVRGLQASAGLIGVAIAGLSLLMSANAEATRATQQAADDYTDALRRSNGVIDESIRQSTAKKLADQGVLDAGRQLGYNLNDLTDAALGNSAAQQRVAEHTQAVRDSFADVTASGADVTATYGDVGGQINKVTNALGQNNTELQTGIQGYKDITAATAAAGGATSNAAIAAQNLADKYGVSIPTFDAVGTSQQKLADKAAQATLKMQQENDAAGLLKQQLDILSGKSLSAAEAQNSFDRAQLSLAGPIKAAQDKIAAAQKQQAAASNSSAAASARQGTVAANTGKVSAGASDRAARAALALSQAQAHLNLVQSNSKATAAQLESAHNRVATASLRLDQAQAKVGTTTGGATKAQRAATSTATAHAAAQTSAANAAMAAAQASLVEAHALTGSSGAAVTNRGNLLGLVQAANQSAEAEGNRTGSSEKGRLKLIELRKEILDNAEANGFNRTKVQEFIDTVLKVPTSVPPTTVDIDTASALRKKKELQDAINALTGKTVTLTLQQVYATVGQPAAQAVHVQQTLDRHGHSSALAQGGIFQGGVRKMAEGGFAGRESTIMRSTNPILWNEAPGGEAYISLAPEKRARSLAIHSQVGALLGANGGSGGRLHPDDIGMLARRIGDEIRRMPTPQIGINQLDAARGGY